MLRLLSLPHQVAINMLNRFDHEVVVAYNGKEGVDAWEAAIHQQQPFQVILMDLQMPIMSGIEAAQEIRRLERQYADDHSALSSMTRSSSEQPMSLTNGTDSGRSFSSPAAPNRGRTPIVCLSASVMDEDQAAARMAGMDMFVSKPLSIQAIDSTLAKVAQLLQ